MNIQIKQRIVGIIIVVALIALLIPFLFVGKKSKDDTLKLAIPESQVSQTAAVETSTEQKIEAPIPLLSDSTKSMPDVVKPIAQKEPLETKNLTPQTVTPVANAAAPVTTDLPVKNTAVVNSSESSAKTAIFVAPATKTVRDDKSGEDLAVDSLAKSTVEAVTPTSAESIVKQEQNVMALSPKKHADKKVKNLKKIKASKSINKSSNRKKTTKIQAKKSINTTTVTTTMGVGSWSVYLGDFPETEEGGLIKKMYDKGYRAYAKKSKTPDGTFISVYVGHLQTQDQAEQLATELQKVTGFSGKTVKTNN